MIGNMRCILLQRFDRNIDSDDALSARLDDDGIEIDGAESAGIRQRELTETYQKIRERLDVAYLAAARAGEELGAFDRVDHRERLVVRQGRHFGPHVVEDFDKDAAETEADR